MHERTRPGSGDGWVSCELGHQHWGRYGAAGLLLGAAGASLLQHRAPRTHEGDTWGVLGGACDVHEDVVMAALREAAEEGGLDPLDVAPLGWSVDDHGGWSYTTVVAAVPAGRVRPTLTARNSESIEIRWWSDDQVSGLPLHPGLRGAWPRLRERPAGLTLVIDAANVVGSRPDGWWHDRVGATVRLRQRLAELTRAAIPVTALPPGVATGGCDRLVPHSWLVVEGAARPAAAAGPGEAGWAPRAVTAVAASGSGDDTVVDVVRRQAAGGEQVVVVTADRQLRARVAQVAVAAAGQPVLSVGPGWLLDLLPPAA